MAQVNYQTSPDTQAPTEAPEDYKHVETSQATFGGALAEGGQSAGQGLLDASKFYSQVSSDQATNNLIQSATNILHGEPGKTVIGPDGQAAPDTGFLGLRGQNAMDAYTDASSALDESIKEQQAGLKTPQARLQFDTESRRYRSQWMAQMGSHVDDQQKTWATDQNNTSVTLGLNDVSRVAADDTASAAAGERVRAGYVKNAQLGGLDVNGAMLKADQQIALTRIDTLAANPATAKDAERVYNASADVLGSLPNYGAIGKQVKGAVIDATMGPAVDKAVGDALTDAQSSARGGATTVHDMSAVSFEQAKARIMAGEGSSKLGGYNAQVYNTSATTNSVGLKPVDLTGMTIGQVMDYQHNVMTPATVGHRGPNDPGTTAVGAYQFERGTLQDQAQATLGPNWRDQPFSVANQDLMAEHLYSSVHGDSGKLAATWPSLASKVSAAGATPSTADALNANMATIQAKAQADAEKLFPGYPDAQDQYVQRVTRRVDQTITQQTRQYEVDAHVVQSVMAGDQPPITEEELKARSPQVAAAWSSMQVNNPMAAMSIERMFDANAKGRSVGNGTQFKDYLDRALAPATDPARLNNPSQLWPFVGPGETAPLTNTGANALSDLMGLRGTPQGEASATQIKAFVDQAHSQLTYSNSAAGLNDPKGEAAFGKFMSATLPVIVKAAKGGNLGSVLDPKSPDFVGKVASTFARSPAQIVSDRLSGEGIKSSPGAIDNPMTLQGLHIAVSEGKIKPDEAAWIANRMGFQKTAGGAPGNTPAPAPPSRLPNVGGLASSPLPGIPMMGVVAQ